jgi:tripartite-type tricarboxylate transporter receptor subunit TctC
MMQATRRGLIGGAATLAALPALAQAEEWRPSRPLRIIVPAPPGGITDIAGRMLANHLQATWGQPCVVDNRAGGGGVTGTVEFLRSAPDGHTLLVGNIGPQATAYTLFRNLPYQPEALAPVSGLIRGPNILVVHPSVPAHTVGEFVAWLRANPRAGNYASSGIGQSPHLSGVWFLQLTGTQATHVPFRGSAPAMAALLAGDVQFMFENLIAASEQVQAGRLRALAVTPAARSPLLPQVPALRETLPQLSAYDVSTWVGLFVHGGAPQAAKVAHNAEATRLLNQPEARATLQRRGSDPHVTTLAEFQSFVAAEIVKWRDVVQREGLVMEMG